MRSSADLYQLERFFTSLYETPAPQGFSAFRAHPLLLYGAGNLGKKLYACLVENGIEPCGFIDRNAKGCTAPAPVYVPDAPELTPYYKDSVVILAGLFGRTQDGAIRRVLAEIGFRHIYALHEINWQSIESRDFLSHMFIGSYAPHNLLRDAEKIRAAYELFSSKEERDFLLAALSAYHAHDVTRFPQPLALEGQYLAADVPEEMDYRRLIDCGAYDGDTLRSILGSGREITAYAACEPQGDLCVGIQRYIAAQKSIREAHILPLGVSDCYEQLHFTAVSDGRSAAKADPTGTAVLPCAPLDVVLHGFAPTMIKMDIEGMEPRALRGARELIQTYHPQLAICVYHDISHLWEIPLQIKELYEGYHLYIRNYQFMGLETVVYAVP